MSEKRESSQRSRAPRKPKKSQIPYAIIMTIIVVVFGFYLNDKGAKLPVFWILGLAFGYILQRSRFCFTAGFRDPCLTGSTSVSRVILVAVGVGTIGVGAYKYSFILKGAETNINMAGVSEIGIPLALGAILFGIGAVIAGGCASGTLMRVGEGFTMQMLSLVFFIIGSLWGAHDMGAFWSSLNANAPKIFLPDVFGWFWAFVVQGLIILLLYIALVKYQKKKLGSSD